MQMLLILCGGGAGDVAAYVQQAWMAADGVHVVAHGMLKHRDTAASHAPGVVTVSPAARSFR